MGLDKTVATIQGEKIHLSDIYQVFDETTFNALAPAKKTAFVRKYAVVKYISSYEQQDLTGINFNIAEEKRSIRRGQKSWYDLRTLKKLKLKMKDKLAKKKS